MQNTRIGHEKIVANQLHPLTQLLGEQFPAIPVTFVHTVLDRDDRVLVYPATQKIGETGGVKRLALGCQQILPIFVEFRARRIQAEVDVVTRLETGLVYRLEDDLDRLFVRTQIRREATLVTHRGRKSAFAEYGFECVKDLGAVTDRLADRPRSHRQDHKLLQVDTVVSVLPTIDDIHHRHRHAITAVTQRLVQRHGLFLCSRMRRGQRDGKHRIGAEAGFVLCPVEVDESTVDRLLSGRVLSQQGIANLPVDVGDGSQHPLAEIASLVAVAQFQRLTRTGRRARRRDRATNGTVIGQDVGFYRGVSARIQNFTCMYFCDIRHFCTLS